MRMIFIFIDGFGIGENDPATNPYYAADTRNFDYLIRRYGVYATDARLGVDGLPQSATGQTAIYTGVNAPRELGRHWPARPNQALRDIILKDNIFISLKKSNRTVTFANTYTKEYLERLEKNPRGIFKPSVTTLLCLSSDTPFRVLEDYQRGYGVFHDITGRKLRENGYDVPLITPERAAENLFHISREYDFTLFEFFMTDLQGHSMEMGKAVYELELLNQMLGSLITLVDLEEDIIVITSDHGNIEDITVKTHTINPVPTIIAGKVDNREAINIKTLTDIKPTVLKIFGV